jgi:hypothetical protein
LLELALFVELGTDLPVKVKKLLDLLVLRGQDVLDDRHEQLRLIVPVEGSDNDAPERVEFELVGPTLEGLADVEARPSAQPRRARPGKKDVPEVLRRRLFGHVVGDKGEARLHRGRRHGCLQAGLAAEEVGMARETRHDLEAVKRRRPRRPCQGSTSPSVPASVARFAAMAMRTTFTVSGWAWISVGAAACVALSALSQRPNFFSAAVYVARSNACTMALWNAGVFSTFLVGRLLQAVFFGPLRTLEVEVCVWGPRT